MIWPSDAEMLAQPMFCLLGEDASFAIPGEDHLFVISGEDHLFVIPGEDHLCVTTGKYHLFVSPGEHHLFVIPGEDPGSIVQRCPLQTAPARSGRRIKSGVTVIGVRSDSHWSPGRRSLEFRVTVIQVQDDKSD